MGAGGNYFAGRRTLRFRRRSAAVDGRKPCARRMSSASFTVMRVPENVVTGTLMMTGALMLEVEVKVALIVGPQIRQGIAESIFAVRQ